MNTENLTAAQTKAIETGGTNNAIVGNSLVKRGIMVANNPDRAIIPFKFVLSSEWVAANETQTDAEDFDLAMQIGAAMEKEYAETLSKEEDAAEAAGTSEAWQIAEWNSVARMDEIEALSDEYTTCDAERGDEIEARLAELGAEVPKLTVSDAEQSLAAAIEADDMQAAGEILDALVPAVAVRDPRETRYAHCDRWTDENLIVKFEILKRRLARKTLLRGDRMQAERHLSHVEKEIEARGL